MMRRPQFTGRDPNYAFASDAGFPLKDGHEDARAMVFLKVTSIKPELHEAKVFTQTEEDGKFTPVASRHASNFTNSYELVGNLQGIAGVLEEKRHSPREVLIRGGVLKHAPKQHRRKSVRAGRAVVDVARTWLMVDIDSAVAGESVPADWMGDPEPVVRSIVKNHMPEAFHDAGVVAHWSSSMSPRGGTPKVHLYFLLSRALYSIEAKGWLAREAHERKIDGALFQPVQQHFTADPQYILHDDTRRPDPLGETRVTLVDGPDVIVPASFETFTPPQREGGHPSENPDRPYRDLPWREAVAMTGEDNMGYHDWIMRVVIPNYWRQEDVPQKSELQAALLAVPFTDIDRHYDRTGPDFDKLCRTHVEFIRRMPPRAISPEDIARVKAERAAQPVITPEDAKRMQAAAHAHRGRAIADMLASSRAAVKK